MKKKVEVEVEESDIIDIELTNEELDYCINNAKKIYKNIIDRKDLHQRDNLERFENVLIGEIAEYSVMNWLKKQGKYVRCAVDKSSPSPDPGHDLELISAKDRRKITCSIKSSLSYNYSSPKDILSKMTIATKKSEVRDINIQVYFWYRLYAKKEESRVTLPSTSLAAIMCWFGKKDLMVQYSSYNHEKRKSPQKKLKDGRKMNELLKYLI